MSIFYLFPIIISKLTKKKIKPCKQFSRLLAIFGLTMIFTVSGWGAKAPVMSPDTMSATITTSAPNGTIIADVNATDEDGDTLSFSITGGNGDGAFSINSSSGIITVSDNSKLTVTTYTLTVVVKDGTVTGNTPRSDTGTVTVTVTQGAISNSDLTITKTGSAKIVTVNRDFYYTIDVTNKGDDTATNIEVVDTLPSAITSINMIATNNDSNASWTCSANALTSPFVVTCEHDNNISSGETQSIVLHVTAPSTSGLITNNVTVTNTTDINNTTTSSTASEQTTITNEAYNADDLCYIVHVPIGGTDCEQEGNFWYGNGCETSVTIVDTNISSENLTNLVVTKMYSPSLDNGSAETTLGTIRESGGSTGGVSTLAITEYTSYTEGYIVDIGNLLVSDANFTLTDYSSYNQNKKMYGIALYADYNVSDVHHTGRIYACTGGEGNIEILSAGDVIDTYIGADGTIANYYNASNDTSSSGIKYIRTMIAGDTTREIVGVHLNLDGNTEVYTYEGEVKANSDPLPFQLTPLWADSTCSKTYGNVLDAAGNRLILEVPSGSYSSPKTAITVPNYVRKDYRIQMIVVDPNSLSVEGQNCLDGSTTGNFEQLAQCVNSEVQYKTAFGQDAWDRCGMDSGLPCLSSNHGIANTTDPTYNAATDYIYTNPLGCYMCTFNIQPSCSSDNFAIRPKAFQVNISDGDTFVSGENINLTFEAENWNNATPTIDYNETEETSFAVDINITDPSKTCQTKIELNPSVEFIDGIDTGDFFFNDVGKDLNFTVQEINGSEYALVDADDSNDTVRLITPFERNISVIPDHFDINATLIDHNTDQNFTYLHDINRYELDDNYSMAAKLTINIQAKGADDNITRNYMETCYSEDTNLTLTLNSEDITYPGAVPPLTHFLYYNPAEDNGTTNSGEGNYTLPSLTNIASLPIENIPSTFPADAPDGNGTTRIEYKLNFDRKIHLAVNPFEIDLTNVDIVEDNVATPPVSGTTGTLTNQKATYYYARSRASKFFYEDITESNVDTPIIIDVYCDLSPTICSATGIDTVLGAINEPNWYVSRGHTSADGNVTLMVGDPLIEGTGDPTINGVSNPTPTDIVTWTSGITNINTVNVATNGAAVPLTVPIELVRSNDTPTPGLYSNEWLIYNPDTDDILQQSPSPFYKVRFIGDSSWTGEGHTGYIVDTNASLKKQKKMDW